MYKRKINLKSVIFKVFFTYLVVYFLALIFKYNYNLESLLNNIPYNYLIALNMISVFLGLPFSMIFDFILLKRFGLYYVLLFSPLLTIVSFSQVLILRKIDLKIFQNILIFKKPKENYFFNFFENFNFKPTYILIIRSFPILPHILGSYIIAASKIKKEIIFLTTFLGTFIYYFFLFFIIGNA